MTDLIIFGSVFAASYFGVEAFRRWSLRTGLLDIPNDRSSHESPTPRGGGLVIVFLSILFYLLISVFVTQNLSWSYLIGATLVAVISWIDDLYSVSSILRILVHSVSAVILIAGIGYWHEIYIPGAETVLNLQAAGAVITFLWIVWMINAYNFMDGIDGLAGLQGVLAGTGWLVYGVIFGYSSLYYYGGVLIFACLGFLIHNWRPAKIFMGDVGSAFLGFTFAAFPLLAAEEKPENAAFLPVIAVSFVWFFVFDTIFTFSRRVLRGTKVWAAHREHLYQRLIIFGMSHSLVSLIYGILTTMVIASALVGTTLRGGWEFLTLFALLVLSILLVILSLRKNIDLNDRKC